MAVDPDDPRVQRLIRAIFDVNCRVETLHERDCWACDAAADVAGTLAAVWDTDDVWNTVLVHDGVPGDTMLDQAHRIAAFVLHRHSGAGTPPRHAGE